MSNSHPIPERRDPAVPTCTYIDVTGIDREGPGLVEPALWHMAHAAAYGCGAMARNGFYAADAAVAALTQTVAATTIVAGHLDGYVADTWPAAAPHVTRAHQLLGEARALLDEAHHHCTLTPSTLEDPEAVHRIDPHDTTDPADDQSETSRHDTESSATDSMLATTSA